MKLEPGSVVLTPDEVAKLRELVDQIDTAPISPAPFERLAETVRDLLTQASDDERKPVVR